MRQSPCSLEFSEEAQKIFRAGPENFLSMPRKFSEPPPKTVSRLNLVNSLQKDSNISLLAA